MFSKGPTLTVSEDNSGLQISPRVVCMTETEFNRIGQSSCRTSVLVKFWSEYRNDYMTESFYYSKETTKLSQLKRCVVSYIIHERIRYKSNRSGDDVFWADVHRAYNGELIQNQNVEYTNDVLLAAIQIKTECEAEIDSFYLIFDLTGGDILLQKTYIPPLSKIIDVVLNPIETLERIKSLF